MRDLSNVFRQAAAGKLRLPSWSLVQALALIAAGLFAYNAARILNDSPPTIKPILGNFDSAMPWLGLALLATLVAAWQPPLPKLAPRTWPAALASCWRTHWLELLLVALILAFGIFMRVYRFGSTLPPADGLCCEEHINGGVAYMALEGERPLLFPLGRWASAAGFLLFGETTLGLRFFFLVMGITTLALFYALLRQLVRAPVALFGLALYAAAWWPSLRSRQASEGTIYAVLFTLLLVRGLKTRSPLTFLGAGILAGLISYEYEAFKPVPMVAAGFVIAAAAHEVLLRAPVQLAAMRERALALLRVAWRPALIFLMATGIVLVPLIVGTSQGKDLYLTSVHRQERSRGGELLADDWPQQMKWAAEFFLPFGPADYPTSPPRDVPGTHLLDPLAASLALAGLMTGIVFLFRGFRLLFVTWLLLSLLVGALLLQNFAPWSFFVLVPVALVLAALFVDDVWTLVARRFGAPGTRTLGALLVIGTGFSFWWNADTLFNDVGTSPIIQRSYGGENALTYALCNYLQGRGEHNFTLLFNTAQNIDGFAGPRETLEEQRRSWGDFIWVCHDLQGRALPAAEEAWPLRDLPAGPITLVFANPPQPEGELIAELNHAYPGLGDPDRSVVGQDYRFISYEFESDAELARPGLWGDYLPLGSDVAATSRVDPVSDLAWDQVGLPLAVPFTVRWRGIVYVAEGGTWNLQAVSDEPTEVRLDGEVVYSTRSGERVEMFIDLVPGWHPVEIVLDKQQEGGTVRLAWTQLDGTRQAVQPEDLFPLAELHGWLHQRALGRPGAPQQFVSQRLDLAPHYALTAVLKQAVETGEPFVTEERWRGVWEIDEPSSYVLSAEFTGGTLTLLVDGVPVAVEETRVPGQHQLEAVVTLDAGRHTLEMVQELRIDVPRSGATLSASREVLSPSEDGTTRTAVPLRVVPY